MFLICTTEEAKVNEVASAWKKWCLEVESILALKLAGMRKGFSKHFDLFYN